IQAQERTQPVNLSCGDIIEGEFTSSVEIQPYNVDVAAGDQLNISAFPLGNLTMSLLIAGSTDQIVDSSDADLDDDYYWQSLESEPTLNTEQLSSNQGYTIYAINFQQFLGGIGASLNRLGDYQVRDSGGVGVYTLFVGCTLRDGTVIEPGDSLEDTADSGSDTSDTGTNDGASASAFSGFGLPALNAIDLSTVNASPLPADVPLSGSLAPDNAMVTAYSITANQGDTVQIDLSRVAGNLNLGVVIVDADGQPVFFSTLIANETLSEAWVAPSTGDYTAGVFPLIAILTDAPESTVFQISVVLNP
ncbi:MAG: hypothetical protein AAFQ52_14825, partial [Chloroflexota bacterium]